MNSIRKNKDILVIKQNILNESLLDKISTLEYKVLVVAISEVKQHWKKLYPVNITLKEFCKIMNTDEKGLYGYIKGVCKKLITRNIEIEKKEKGEFSLISWLSRIDYKDGIISIKFNNELEEEILLMVQDKGYTKYFIKNIADMESKYSIRIYEITKQYEKIRKRIVKVDMLKAMIGAKNIKTYNNFNNFKVKVLNPAIKEINTKTDIIIDFEEIKEGRKVIAVRFFIKSKVQSNENDFEEMKKPDLILSIQSKVHALTAKKIPTLELIQYHRIILIELIKKIDKGTFENVVIQHPKAFFKWHLDDINNNYDQERLFKEKKDY